MFICGLHSLFCKQPYYLSPLPYNLYDAYKIAMQFGKKSNHKHPRTLNAAFSFDCCNRVQNAVATTTATTPSLAPNSSDSTVICIQFL
jgi:hypothetical protein